MSRKRTYDHLDWSRILTKLNSREVVSERGLAGRANLGNLIPQLLRFARLLFPQEYPINLTHLPDHLDLLKDIHELQLDSNFTQTQRKSVKMVWRTSSAHTGDL